MPLTYNKIIQLSREFQQAHYKLNHFGNGADFNTVLENIEGGTHYPIMWMEDLPMPLQTGVEVMSFRVGFLALVEQLEDRETSLISANRNEVISDMMSCAKDFVAYWVQDHTYDDFRINKAAPRSTVEDVTPDKLWGCYVDITFEQAFRYDKCAIPMSGVTPPPSTDVIITINSASYTVVACGETVNIPVVDELGNPVGSKIGDDWVVNTTGIPAYNMPPLTFTVSYNNFDEGYLKIAGEYANTITTGTTMQARDNLDFYKVQLDLEALGHLHRCLGIDGGYYNSTTNTYHLADGTPSSRAVVFTAGAYGFDRVTGIGWVLGTNTGNLTSAIAFCEGYNLHGFTNYHLPTKAQMDSSIDLILFAPWNNNFSPVFNIPGTVRTCTPWASSPTINGWFMQITGATTLIANATSVAYTICRDARGQF